MKTAALVGGKFSKKTFFAECDGLACLLERRRDCEAILLIRNAVRAVEANSILAHRRADRLEVEIVDHRQAEEQIVILEQR